MRYEIILATGLFLTGIGLIIIGKVKKYIGIQVMGIGLIFIGISFIL